eukprot:Tamp_17565.p1 GENE.Tamp_17565~~Tamp_17565.p1  ORF type:complete len:219 (+),score=12.10 Tamp_17565:612-1268(+)
MITRFPHLITLSIAKTLRPTYRYLCSLGLSSSQLGTLLASYPYTLAYSVPNKLEPAVSFLVHELGVPRSSLAKLLLRKPQLLGYSIANKLRPTVAFFTHELGFSLNTVAAMVVRCPALLGYSVSRNLRPTAHFLCSSARLYNASEADWSRQLQASPQLLTYSLEQRIKPRVKATVACLHKKPLSAATVARALKATNKSFGNAFVLTKQKNPPLTTGRP